MNELVTQSPLKESKSRKRKGAEEVIGPYPNNIKLYREKIGMLRRELALKYGCSQVEIGRIERGGRRLTLDMVDKFSRILCVEPRTLTSAMPAEGDAWALGALMGTAKAERLDPQDWTLVPGFNAKFIQNAKNVTFAADGREVSAKPEYFAVYARDFLENYTKSTKGKLLSLSHLGSDMSPTFGQNDRVLLDTAVSTVGSNGVYGLLMPWSDEIIFRRVQRSLRDGSLTVSADGDPSLTQEGVTAEELVVVGKVVLVEGAP